MAHSAVSRLLFRAALFALSAAALGAAAQAQTPPLAPPSLTPPSMAPPSMSQPQAGQAAAPTVSARPKSLKLFPDAPQGIKGTPLRGNEFLENQQRLLMVVEFEPGAIGMKIDVAVMSVRTTAGLEQLIFTASDKVGPDGRLPIELRLPNNWPVGFYDVRLGASERLIATLPFKINATAPRNTPIKAVTDIGIVVLNDATQQVMTAAPKVFNRHIYFLLDTTGANTSGANVTWTRTALATEAGNNISIGENTIENWPLDNTRLAFDIELPRDWPPGKYRVEAKIGGQLLNARNFDIQP